MRSIDMPRQRSKKRLRRNGQGSNLIYHYTSPDSLVKIVEGNCFWASDLNAVNDPAELIHVRTGLAEVCERLGRCAEEPDDYQAFAQYVYYVGDQLKNIKEDYEW